ncbi:hypothetical protein ACM614_26360 [Streptomyces sp. 12297]|uniref:hypothetical protein n=1 Tax=Streptomyces sp. NBC_00239 TaxID=2903640 RepID=UPI002E28FBC9|nr:hypothetical protein [Streptomyces sp. NBC_00239]
MEHTPTVAVGPPDDLGLRKVSVEGKTLGTVMSAGELQRLLRRHGLAFEHDVQWHGGDSTVWPDRAWPRRVTGAFMALGLLATAALLIRFGMADASGALTYAGRLAGASFVAAGGVEALGAVAAFDYWTKRQSRFSGGVVLLAVSISLVINVALLVVQIAGGIYTRYLWVWITLIVWSVWGLCVLVRARAWKGLHHPQRIAVGAVLSGVLAGANLLYSQVYVPQATKPMVESNAAFQPTSFSQDGKRLYMPVHLTVRNSGNIPVYVLGSIYWIHGKLRNSSEYKLITSLEFIAPPGRALNPGEEFSGDAVVPINDPVHAPYETVRAQTEVYMVRQDRTTIDPAFETSKRFAGGLREQGLDKDPEGPPGDYFRYQATVSNSNEILNATRGRHRVTLWWMYNAKSPYLYVHVGPSGEKKAFDPDHPNANKEENDRYGLTRVRGSRAEKPLAELLDHAQDERQR